jgi:hypothetical protein
MGEGREKGEGKRGGELRWNAIERGYTIESHLVLRVRGRRYWMVLGRGA